MVRQAGILGFMAVLAGCAMPVAPVGPSQTQLTFLQAPIAVSGLIGATPNALNAEFGPPVLRRVDGPAQVWLYHSPVCGLNLILYPDPSGTPRVAAAVPDNNDPARCTESLQRLTVSAALEHPASS